MKEKFDKLIITRPRHGSSWDNPDIRLRRRDKPGEDYEGDTRASMKPRNRSWIDRKQLNEYLNPLIRFLEKSVGKLWDNVYSEIRKVHRPGTAVGEHVYTHLKDMVEVAPMFKDDGVYKADGGKLRGNSTWWDTFYVDNKGILRRVDKEKRTTPKTTKNVIKGESDTVYYIKREDDGVWFALEYAQSRSVTRTRLDGTIHTYISQPGCLHHKEDMPYPRVDGHYPRKFRTLSKKEKKVLGLT